MRDECRLGPMQGFKNKKVRLWSGQEFFRSFKLSGNVACGADPGSDPDADEGSA